MVIWRVKCVMSGSNLSYTTLLLGNPKIYVHNFVFLGTLQIDNHNTDFIPVYFRSSELSNPCMLEFLYFFHPIYFIIKSILENKGSNS